MQCLQDCSHNTFPDSNNYASVFHSCRNPSRESLSDRCRTLQGKTLDSSFMWVAPILQEALNHLLNRHK